MSYGKDSDDSTAPSQWSPMDRSPVPFTFTFASPPRLTQTPAMAS